MINDSTVTNEKNNMSNTIKNNHKTSHKRELSFQEIQHNLINLLNTKPETLNTTGNIYKSDTSKYDFDNYKYYISNTLEQYNIPSNKYNEFITTNDNFNIKRIKYLNKNFYSTFNLNNNNNNNNNDNNIYYEDENPINVYSKRYNSPTESLNVIKNNQKLY